MTANPPPHSLSGRLRRITRTTVAVSSLLLATVANLLTGPAALAATPTPTPEDTAPELSVVLAPENHGSYTTGAPFSASLSIGNEGEIELPAGTVSLDFGRTPLVSRSALMTWLDDETSFVDLDPLMTAVTPVVPVDERDTTSMLVPGAILGQLEPGIYPLRATVAVPHGDSLVTEKAARSVVVVSAPDAVTSPLSVIVPITATPSGSILSAKELAALTAPDGALTAQLDALMGTSAIIAVDPSIIAAIRALGSTAPASATNWLTRLSAASNDVFLLQFADADVTAQVAGGLTEPLQPTTLEPFISLDGFAPVESEGSEVTPSPSPTATETETDAPDATELPTLAQLTSLNGARENFFWPRGEISADELAALSRVKTSTGAPAIVLPSTSFVEGADAGVVAPRVDADGAIVLVTDTPLSRALSLAAGEPDGVRRSAALAEVHALRSFVTGSEQILVGLDRNDVRAAAALRDTLTTATDSRAASLTELLTAPPLIATLSSKSDSLRASAIDPLREDEQDLSEFSSILLDPAQLTARERISILQLLAVGKHVTDEEFETALETHRAGTVTTLNAVGIQPSNPILISAAVDVPVWVRNDLPYPIALRLEAHPSDGRIEVQRSMEVEALPSSTARVKVPVESRIASGEVDLTLTLISNTGVQIGTPQVASLTVRAEWETIGLISFGSLAVLLIGAGVFRTIHKRRMDATAAPTDAPESTTTEDAPTQH